MYIVTTGSDILRIHEGSHYYPGLRYLVSHETLLAMRELQHLTGFSIVEESQEVSSLAEYGWKNWQQGDDAKSLLVWNTGKLGDQLWTTALVRKIKKHNPHLAIDVVTDNVHLWFHNKDIRGIRKQPVPAEASIDHDAILLIDGLVAYNLDPNQKNCYEQLFEYAGFTEYDANEMKPVFNLSLDDERRSVALRAEPGPDGDVFASENHFALGLHSSSVARNLSAPKWIAIIRALTQLLNGNTDIKIYGLANNDFGLLLQDEIRKENFPNYVELNAKLGLREIGALVRTSRCVVSVDSMLIHMAAAFNTPTVALMSTVPPAARVSTYPFCVPLYYPQACRFSSECFWKGDGFRDRAAERNEFALCYTPQRFACDLMRAVNPADVIKNMHLAIGQRIEFDKNVDFVFPPLSL